jgi:hypothetical protein
MFPMYWGAIFSNRLVFEELTVLLQADFEPYALSID